LGRLLLIRKRCPYEASATDLRRERECLLHEPANYTQDP
jgi:hypothetical protein